MHRGQVLKICFVLASGFVLRMKSGPSLVYEHLFVIKPDPVDTDFQELTLIDLGRFF